MAVLREADAEDVLSLGKTGCQDSFRAKQENGNNNRKFRRVAAGPVHAVEENLKELISDLIAGLKKADGSWETQLDKDTAQMPCSCLRVVFFPH